jgi:hypothetical protein
VLPKVRLPSDAWRPAAAAPAVALILVAATAPGAIAARVGFDPGGSRAQPRPSCLAIPASSSPVIPQQTIGSVRRRGLEVRLHTAHSSRWILIVTASAGGSGRADQGSQLPIGSTTKLLPSPGRASVRVRLDGTTVPAGLRALPLTLIWTETEGSGKCTVFNSGETPRTLRPGFSGSFFGPPG